MADSIDLANDLIDKEVSFALKMNKLKQQTTAKLADNEFCSECGDNIPDVRREMGFHLCITCASDAERRQSQFADNQ
jgi:RNA polymerase-binding transcription factor DksA